MNEISRYFKEELNKSVFERQDLVNRIQNIDNELAELANQEERIIVREDNPDFVFQVECFERSMDEKTLTTINDRRSELTEQKKNLTAKIEETDCVIERFRNLFSKACKGGRRKQSNEALYSQLEFIMKLMDSDVQRAKLELANLLKEEKTDAN